MAKTKQFKAILTSGGKGREWPVIKIPFNVEKEFGSAAQVSVQGTVNGFAFRSSIFPVGDGSHILMVDRQMRDGARAKEGDLLSVSMEVDGDPHTIDIPADFQRALKRKKAAQAFFDQLPPSHQRAYIESIVESKSDETRSKRIAQAIQILSAGKS
jgi:hypothetical protein